MRALNMNCMNNRMISLTTASLILLQNVSQIAYVNAQESSQSVVVNAKNTKVKDVVYLSSANGSPLDGDGTLSKPYQNIKTALDNVKDGGIIKLVGDVSYTKYEPHPDGSAMPLFIDKNITIEGASGRSPLDANADSFTLRAPIQLGGDVTFRNINLQLVPEVSLGKVNSKVLGENKPLATTIFAAGHTLVLDNVNTRVGTNINQKNQRPYISGGLFKNTGEMGSKSVIKIINPNSETIISGIFAGDYWNERTMDVDINIDCKVLDNEIYLGGISNTLNGTVDITLGSKCTVSSFNSTNHNGEVNLTIGSDIIENDMNIENIDNLSVGGNSKIILKRGSIVNINNINLKEGSLIDFRAINGNPVVKENFKSENSSILLSDNQFLDVGGQVTGTTKLNHDGGVFNEYLTEGHEYIKARSDSLGEFKVSEDLSTIFTVQKNDINNRAVWSVKRLRNTFKSFKWEDGVATSIKKPNSSDEFVYPIEFTNTNGSLYAPYDEDWDEFEITLTKADGTVLTEDSALDDKDVGFYISYFGSAVVLYVKNPKYEGDVIFTIKHLETQQEANIKISINGSRAELSGSVLIEGDIKVGGALTAKVNSDVKEDKLNYKWYLNDIELIGENKNTIELSKEYVGEIKVIVSCDDYEGTLVSDKVLIQYPSEPEVDDNVGNENNPEIEQITIDSVKDLKVTSNKYDVNEITWISMNDVDGYEVYCSTDKKDYKLVDTTNNNRFKHSNLKTGVEYYYKVRALKNVNGEIIYGEYSDVKSFVPKLTSTKATVSPISYKSNKLSWGKVAGASGYVIYQSSSKDGSYSKIKTVTSGSTTSYTHSGLSTGKNYYYKVRAYRVVDGKNVYGPLSSSIVAKPSLDGTIIKASSASYRSNKIAWGKVAGASGYVIYQSSSKDGSYSKIKTVTSGSTTSYTHSGLSTGKNYYYKVRAYRVVDGKNVYGPLSSSIVVKPKLSTPKVSLTTSSKKVIVKWNKIDGASGYEIYRANSKNGSFSKVKTITKGSTLSYVNSNLSSKKNYYYKVRVYRAVNGKKVYSSFSEVKSIKVK